MQLVEASKAKSERVGAFRDGVLNSTPLLVGTDGTPNNYLLFMTEVGAGGFSTPRHRHNFDQIRYPVTKDFSYAEDKVLPEGWVGYFPEGVYYGPQDRVEGLLMMVCQFGGASGSGYISASQREQASKELQEEGEFKKGKFFKYGSEKSQDGFEACFERVRGSQLRYAAPRYEAVILMNPKCFDWIPDNQQGIYHKQLGCFTERNTVVGFTRVESGATLKLSGGAVEELMFLAEGSAVINDRECERFSAVSRSPEDVISITAKKDSQFFRIRLPKF
jgi:hypothetical protein